MLTQIKLKEILHYCPETGIFTRKVSLNSNNAIKGAVFGSRHNSKANSYLRGWVLGSRYYLHRLAFLYMTGSIPDIIDHKNRIKYDNRWDNLISGDSSLNHRNMPLQSNNTSGTTGVYESDKRYVNKFYARIYDKDGIIIKSARFKTIDEAISWRKMKELEIGYSENHGLILPQDRL